MVRSVLTCVSLMAGMACESFAVAGEHDLALSKSSVEKATPVKAELTLSPKKSAPKSVKSSLKERVPGERDAPPPRPEPRPERAAQGKPKKPPLSMGMALDDNPGEDAEARWNDYFSAHHGDQAPSPASVRLAARQLFAERKFDDVIALIHGALRNRQGHPWMFEALGLALQAAGRPEDEIERALMSALDFANHPGEMLLLAQHLERAGLHRRALQLLRQAGDLDPAAPLLQGLELAQRLDDLPAIQWAALGILRQARPQQQTKIKAVGCRAAGDLLDRFRREGRQKEADAFQAALDDAVIRDCVVVVSWSGDADVNLAVEEPTGTQCSFRNPRTSAGGVILDDLAFRPAQQESGKRSEVYVCSQGFDGTYHVRARRVWGKLAANRITMDVYWHYRSKREKRQTQSLELVGDEAAAAFELEGGRRTEPLAERRLAEIVEGQLAAQRQIISLRLRALHDQRAARRYLSAGNQLPLGTPLERNPANARLPLGVNFHVGYQPWIITLPKGASMWNLVAISPDRRTVRVSTTAFFSGVSEANTFNYVSGASGRSDIGVGYWGYGVGANSSAF